MEKMRLKVEHAPERCDICHQSDFFDSNKNVCLRCLNVKQDHTNSKNELVKTGSLLEIIKQDQPTSDLALFEFIRQTPSVMTFSLVSSHILLTTTLFIVTYMFGTLMALPIALISIIFLIYMVKAMRNIKKKIKQCKKCLENNIATHNHCFNCGSPFPVNKSYL